MPNENKNRLFFIQSVLVNWMLKWDHIKRLITLTNDNIKRLSLYNYFFQQPRNNLRRNSLEIPSLSSILPKSDENEQFLVPRSKSEHSGMFANRRSALGTILSVSSGSSNQHSKRWTLKDVIPFVGTTKF